MKVNRLEKIFRNTEFQDNNELSDKIIKKIVYDSRKVEKDSLFVAIKGFSTDGHDYLEEAEKKGAVATIVETKNTNLKIPQFVTGNSREILPKLAANFYDPELNKLRIVGITGTNGKTTTSYLVRSIMNAAGLDCGLIGTIEYNIGGKTIKAWNTTPESVDLFEMLYNMSREGQRGCALEVSSHALELHRVDHLEFEVGVFTNLTQDHLDFHEDLEDYFCAKKKLFEFLKENGYAVVNIDDDFGKRLQNSIKNNLYTYGFSNEADIFAGKWHTDLKGLTVDIHTPIGAINIKSPLIGEFNVENILSAVSVGIAMNFNLKHIKSGIEKLKHVPGRLEPIEVKDNCTVIVDYAHTPDALQKTLKVLNKLNKKNLWVVFGCGGNRDKKKRSLMGLAAQKNADKIIVTSDNSRNENPETIINDILDGINKNDDLHVEIDRKKAIEYSIRNSSLGDIILIAGKGHEDYQEIEGIKYPFDDRDVIKEFLH